jgi:hypothetical protein
MNIIQFKIFYTTMPLSKLMSLETVLVCTLLLIGINWCLWYILKGFTQYISIRKKGVKCSARIEGIAWSRYFSYYPKISFVVKKRKYCFTSKFGCSIFQLNKLRKKGLTVYYMKDDPQKAVIVPHDLYGHISSVAMWLFFMLPVEVLFVGTFLGIIT